MNKSRRMAAMQARALSTAGWTVLQMDLYGCGDSDGDFADAGWSLWLNDIAEAADWLHRRSGVVPVLWGLRAGCLLVSQVARQMAIAPNLLLWQPALSGRQYLQQFLRLKLAGRLFDKDSPDRTDTDGLREQLRRGEPVEVAGYSLAPALALGLDATELQPPPGSARVAWLQVVDAAASLSPAVLNRVEAWQRGGARVAARTVAGPAFWQTQEITECPALVEATVAALEEWTT
jgi:exosortase A-associated hydrolase 2